MKRFLKFLLCLALGIFFGGWGGIFTCGQCPLCKLCHPEGWPSQTKALRGVAKWLEDHLKELEKQLDRGVITQEEYERKMAEVREEYEKWEKSVKSAH